MAYTNSPLELAKCLAGMSYADLIEVANELVEMNQDPEAARDVATRHGMADTLADWAESQIEADEEIKRSAKPKAVA